MELTQGINPTNPNRAEFHIQTNAMVEARYNVSLP